MNTKLLLVGGEGFIGRNLAEKLSQQWKCFSIGRSMSIFRRNKIFHDVFIKLDPYKERLQNKFDIIVHLIDNKKKGYEYLNDEIKFIRNLNIESCKYLIVFSSAVVYADPNSEYGIRKKSLEQLYFNFCKKNNINLAIVRLFNAYGPYQLPIHKACLVANIFYNYLIGNDVKVKDVNTVRDFIFSQDIGGFVNHLIKTKFVGITDIASGKMLSVENIINIIKTDVVQDKLRVINSKRERNLICPTAKNILPVDFRLKSISHGLRETYEFYKNNLDVIRKLFVSKVRV